MNIKIEIIQFSRSVGPWSYDFTEILLFVRISIKVACNRFGISNHILSEDAAYAGHPFIHWPDQFDLFS